MQHNLALGNSKALHDGIKTALGPDMSKPAPILSKSGEKITDQTKQLERWVDHYLEIYATQNLVADDALSSLPDLSILDSLDETPSLTDLSNAINSLKNGKAPGSDGIPAEIIKASRSILIPELHELLCLCCESGYVPQDMRDASIVTLYKNKGNRSDCNSYRGISLLSIVGKIFARVALPRLQVVASRVYPESQCGFRSGRSTIDMISSL
jgi:Reverse transcriptase (RNA-dependent DNA polymerase)